MPWPNSPRAAFRADRRRLLNLIPLMAGVMFVSRAPIASGADAPRPESPPPAAQRPTAAASPALTGPQADLPEGAAILVHGGAGTRPELTAELLGAVAAGARALARPAPAKGSAKTPGSPGASESAPDAPALAAAIAACVALEDHPLFNAGTGSNIRMDGETVQMDAAVMDQTGDFGAVAVIERVKNPVLVAREVMRSPHLMIAGAGAISLARTMGMPDYDPRCPENRERYRQLQARMARDGLGEEWRDFDWKKHWNFPTPLGKALEQHDTIGAVARDGRGGFAAGVSTGGTSTTLFGRVGDAPVMGAGIYAGPAGAVCATGWGEYIIRENLSRRVYEWMADGASAREAVRRGLALFPAHIGVGLIAVSATDEAAASNTSMAWAGMAGSRTLRADQAGEP